MAHQPSRQSLTTVDPNLVNFNGPNDPLNPQNLPAWQNWLYANIIDWLSLVVTFATSVFSAAAGATATEFHVSPQVTTLGTALFIAGFAAGTLLFGPLSELYGRKRPLMAGYFVFVILQIPVGVAQNVETLIICRFLGGVAAYLGWRWTAWITMIMAVTAGLIGLVFLPETYAPLLLQRKAAQLRLETRNWALHAKLDESPITFSSITTRYLSRPLLMLTHEPVLQLITTYMTFIYGFIYLLSEAYPISFIEERHYTLGIGALPFLSIGLGVILGSGYIFHFTNRTIRRTYIATGHVRPEERLYPMIPGSIMPPGLAYLVDVYTLNANSAISANAFVRSTVAAGLTMFATPMYHRLGVRWASSLLGFFGVAFIPTPIIFYIYGERIRKTSRYSPTL
ncbi:major facilitator superfamily domain-containing protein [Aspergillus stella-maris]|uniref:major facilitator superfamily domain-containing protein n=1 Tax=Aspergillus stella-maris TaxID=1810926 RepID=UPI003CCDD068